ncbi:MAG: hypothetical protein ACI4Q3_00560 [Kiritimatiellia bacterium]
MKLTDILAKIAKGEALTDDEKKFAGEYNEQTSLDAAAAKARKKAEAEAAEWKTKAEKAAADLAEALEKNSDHSKDTEIAKLTKRLETIEKKNAALEAEKAATARNLSIRDAMKAAGITAAKGVDADTLHELISMKLRDTDLEDADAVKTVFDAFKKANPSMIAAGGIGGAGVKGTPGGMTATRNPWKKETFNLTEQIELTVSNPELAAAMKAEAGNP